MFSHPKIWTFIFALLFTLTGDEGFCQLNQNEKEKKEEKNNMQNAAGNSNPVMNNSIQENNVVLPAINEPSRTAQSNVFYDKQSNAYKSAVEFNQLDAKAWLGYYESERYSFYTKTSNDINAENQEKLNEIISEMGKYVPNSYEYNYAKYLNGNHDVNLFGFLARAYELNPKASELYDQFVAYYELTGNASKKSEWCKKLNESGEFSKEVMEFSYNLLAGLPSNAVLITHGEMDTYPTFIWQTVKKFRPDVLVLYIDLLEKSDYRIKKSQELGFSSSIDPVSNKPSFVQDICQKISPKRPVFLASTLAPELLKPIKEQLFNTGLAFRYAPGGIDNLADLETNWERNFKTEELRKKISPGTIASKINMNYVPGLLLLSESLKQKGMSDKAKLAEELALKIAAEGGKEQQVRTLLNKK